MEMEISYDEKTDVFYAHKVGAKSVESLNFGSLVLDFNDEEGGIVGIEILNFSQIANPENYDINKILGDLGIEEQ